MAPKHHKHFFKMSWVGDMCALSINKTQTDWLPCTNHFNQPENVFLVLLSHTHIRSATVQHWRKKQLCQLILMDHPSFCKTFGQVRTIICLLFLLEYNRCLVFIWHFQDYNPFRHIFLLKWNWFRGKSYSNFLLKTARTSNWSHLIIKRISWENI